MIHNNQIKSENVVSTYSTTNFIVSFYIEILIINIKPNYWQEYGAGKECVCKLPRVTIKMAGVLMQKTKSTPIYSHQYVLDRSN